MNKCVIEWKEYLESLSAEYIIENAVEMMAWEGGDGILGTYTREIEFQMGGRSFMMDNMRDMSCLSEEGDRELFEATDLSNFKEAIRVMTL